MTEFVLVPENQDELSQDEFSRSPFSRTNSVNMPSSGGQMTEFVLDRDELRHAPPPGEGWMS